MVTFWIIMAMITGGLIGFIIGVVYSDNHWMPIVRKYKRLAGMED